MSTLPRRPPRRVPLAASLVAMAAAVLAPGAARQARAADLPTVAVLGVHGNGEQDEELLDGVRRDLIGGFEALGLFSVMPTDAARARLRPERRRILDAVFLGPAQQAFDEGRLLDQQARPDAAVEAFERASAALEGVHEFPRAGRLATEVALQRGLALLTMGRADEARGAFAAAALRDPDRVLDPLEYPPSTVEVFESVRRDLRAGGTGSLDVDVEAGPPARVSLDGRPVGTTPLRLDGVLPGEHDVVLEGEGGRRVHARVTVSAKAAQKLRASPQPRGLARDADPFESERSGATRRLVRELAAATGADLVVVAAFDEKGDFRVALYSARSQTFSQSLVASLAAAPGARGAFVHQLVQRLERYLEAGTIRPERVDTQVVPMRLGANPKLNELLFGEDPTAAPAPATGPVAEVEPERKGPHPGAVVGVILGILAGGGAAAAIVYGTQRTGPSGTVTVTFP